jgi:hypothetical protein
MNASDDQPSQSGAEQPRDRVVTLRKEQVAVMEWLQERRATLEKQVTETEQLRGRMVNLERLVSTLPDLDAPALNTRGEKRKRSTTEAVDKE